MTIYIFDKEQKSQIGIVNTLSDFIPREGDIFVMEVHGKETKLNNRLFKVFQVEYPVVISKINESRRVPEYEALITSKERNIGVSAFEYS